MIWRSLQWIKCNNTIRYYLIPIRPQTTPLEGTPRYNCLGEAFGGVRIVRAARLHGGGGGGGRLRDLGFEESWGCQISSAPDRVSAITGLLWQVVVIMRGNFRSNSFMLWGPEDFIAVYRVAFLFEGKLLPLLKSSPHSMTVKSIVYFHKRSSFIEVCKSWANAMKEQSAADHQHVRQVHPCTRFLKN